MQTCDVIVAGIGGMGAAACCHLARRGARVLGLDRFCIAHDRGSSHGQTRLIRLAYHEHPDYVPLLRRAYDLWRDLERVSDRPLLVESGLVLAGPSGCGVLAGAALAARIHGLSIERLDSAAAAARWPALRIPAKWDAIHEPRGGYLFVEECVRAHADAARAAGADLRTGVSVIGWRTVSGGVVVETDAGVFTADRLVLCPGPWAAQLLQLPAVSLTVLRKSLFWYEPDEPHRSAHSAGTLPCFAFDTPSGFVYGFPRLDARGLKIAEHTGGTPVADPLSVDRDVDPRERARIEGWLTAHLPGVGRRMTTHATCLYTMSPDGHFVVGLHPDHPRVAIAAGFSGHGFKFASVVGEILADLATAGTTSHPIDFLSPLRFG